MPNKEIRVRYITNIIITILSITVFTLTVSFQIFDLELPPKIIAISYFIILSILSFVKAHSIFTGDYSRGYLKYNGKPASTNLDEQMRKYKANGIASIILIAGLGMMFLPNATVRYITMGVSIIAIIGGVIGTITGLAEVKQRKARKTWR